MSVETILLTGASGALGQEVTRQLRRRYPRAQLLSVSRSPLRGGLPGVFGDLTLPGLGNPGLAGALAGVTHAVHIAADVRWNRPLGEAFNVNTLGTARLLRLLSRAAPRLERFVHVSTAFVERPAGCPDCPPPLLRSGRWFNNTYEYSKWLGEAIVRRTALPWVVVRPSLVVGRACDGYIGRHNGLYSLFEFLARGRLAFLVGRGAGPIDIVPADVCARAVVDGIEELAPGTTAFAGSGPLAPSASEVLDAAVLHLNRARRERGVEPVQPAAVIRCATYVRLLRPLMDGGMSPGQRRLLSTLDVFHPYVGLSGRFGAASGPAYLAPPFASYAEAVIRAWCEAQPQAAFATGRPWTARPSLQPLEALP